MFVCCPSTQGVHGGFLQGNVYVEQGKARFVPGEIDPNGAAFGSFNSSLFTTGWGVLDIKAGFSKQKTADVDAAFAAGYLEGVVTSL